MEQITKKVYDVISKGGVALIKLNVAYALIGHTCEAVHHIFELKRRPPERKGVMLGNPNLFKELSISLYHKRVEGFTYPVGLVTKINHASKYASQIPDEAKHNERVAIFVNMGELGYRVSNYAFTKGKLIFGSSANISNAGNHYSFDEVEDEIRKNVDFAVDLGQTEFQELRPDGKGYSSTMIDLENDLLLRRGLLCDKVVQQAREMGLKIPNY